MRMCDVCAWEKGETCSHPKAKKYKKEWATFEGDIWDEDKTPEWCPILMQRKELNNGSYKY